MYIWNFFFFFQAEDGIRDGHVTGVQTCALPILWYTEPAADWLGALPVGNGRLGAMVHGGVEREVLQLNEDTVWAGGPRNNLAPRLRRYREQIPGLGLANGQEKARPFASGHWNSTNKGSPT